MKYRICALTGTRADYGLLRRTLLRLEKNDSVDLEVVITGSHLDNAFGRTAGEVIADGFSSYFEMPIPLEDDTEGGMAFSAGAATQCFALYLEKRRPDLLLVLGDRYEALAAAVAAHLSLVPVAHISGGDVTEGAVDNAIRHSITKLSQLHFPGCAQSARRIVQMGEQPEHVFNVGEPGVENCIHSEIMSREELAKSLGSSLVLADYGVVTYHPVTLEAGGSLRHVKDLADAMASFEDMGFVITLANADAGGRAINRFWETEGARHDNWIVFPSLGSLRYLSAVKHSCVVLGNSSSGIIEAPALGVPSVNIGNRQKGRMTPELVVNCDTSSESIRSAIQMALSTEFYKKAVSAPSPYGDGTTSLKIERHILDYLANGKLDLEKPFYDIPDEEWGVSCWQTAEE